MELDAKDHNWLHNLFITPTLSVIYVLKATSAYFTVHMCRLGCRPHVAHGVLATYDKETFYNISMS